jgi:hypothetical protein
MPSVLRRFHLIDMPPSTAGCGCSRVELGLFLFDPLGIGFKASAILNPMKTPHAFKQAQNHLAARQSVDADVF